LRFLIICDKNIFVVLGKRWTYDVLKVISKCNSVRFGEILIDLKINSSTLSRILKCLTFHTLIDKQILNNSPVEIRYCLNNKGQKLFSQMELIKNI